MTTALQVELLCPDCRVVCVLDGVIARCPACAWPFTEELLKDIANGQSMFPPMPVVKVEPDE